MTESRRLPARVVPARRRPFLETQRRSYWLAYLLEKLKSIKEGDGTLLDHSMIVYGAGIGDGNRHNHDDLPVLLAGGGNGTISTGRHVRYEQETPMTNLFLSMLDRVGVSVPFLGDSTGRLPGLEL